MNLETFRKQEGAPYSCVSNDQTPEQKNGRNKCFKLRANS
jgi:hypothetical protein